ncbi:MAG: hypothetical protein ABFD10_10260 [Prolixibacteraceae bacterium]
MTQKTKTTILPAAMVTGILMGLLLPQTTATLNILTPYLIFVMLLVPYCRLPVKDIKLSALHYRMLGVQMLLAALAYAAFAWFNPRFAQGAFICFFGPTATAAPVITAMLGGSIAVVVTYSLLSSITVAVLSPIVFSLIGVNTEMSFFTSVGMISRQVFPMIILPFFAALFFKNFMPKVHAVLKERQNISFYLWAFSMILLVGRATTFVINQPASQIPMEAGLALIAAFACAIQFLIGHKLGIKYGEPVAGTQGMGQKNTVLIFWLAITYLDPITSVAPISYIICHNAANSLQLHWHYKKLNNGNVLSDV